MGITIIHSFLHHPTRAHANADGLSKLLITENYKKLGSHSEANLFNIIQIESFLLTSGQLKQVTRTDPRLSKVLMIAMNGWPMQASEALKPYWKEDWSYLLVL